MNLTRAIGFCDDELGWFEANWNLDEKPMKNNSRKVTFKSDDTILMLDSSWEFFNLHDVFLKVARIQGAEVVSCLYDTVPITMEAMCNPAVPPVFVGWLKTALVYSTGFVCISRAVADELHALLKAIGFPRRMKIGYWQLGADFSDRKIISPTKAAKERPVFLMVELSSLARAIASCSMPSSGSGREMSTWP